MLITRAPFVDRPADRLRLGLDRDRPARRDDLRHHELGRGREAGDARRVVELGGDDPRDDRPVAAGVLGGAAHEALREGDAPDEVRMHEIDPGVDHRDANGRERRQRLPGVVGAVRDRVPLARRERVGRLERETALARRLDPGDARNGSKRRETCIGGQRPKRREPLDARARRPLDRACHHGRVRTRLDPDMGSRAEARRRETRARRSRRAPRGGRAASRLEPDRECRAGEAVGGQPEHGRRVETDRHRERPVVRGRNLPHLGPGASAATALEDDGLDVPREPVSRTFPLGSVTVGPSSRIIPSRNPVDLRPRRARTSLRRTSVEPAAVARRIAAGRPGAPGRYETSVTAPPIPKRFASCGPVRSCEGHRKFGETESQRSSTAWRYGISVPKASSELIVRPPLEEK